MGSGGSYVPPGWVGLCPGGEGYQGQFRGRDVCGSMGGSVPSAEVRVEICDCLKVGLSGRASDLLQPTASSHIADIRGMIRLEY